MLIIKVNFLATLITQLLLLHSNASLRSLSSTFNDGAQVFTEAATCVAANLFSCSLKFPCCAGLKCNVFRGYTQCQIASPTYAPTTFAPTMSTPTLRPTLKPSHKPSVSPSHKPSTSTPSGIPTLEPSSEPSIFPSIAPIKVATAPPPSAYGICNSCAECAALGITNAYVTILPVPALDETLVDLGASTGVFAACTSIINVIIAPGITDISRSFWDCSNLITVNIPPSVQLMDSSFQNCNSLNSLVVPVGVRTLGGQTCHNCWSLTQLFIPETVTSLGKDFCEGCASLTTVNLPPSIIYMGDYVLSGCRNLVCVYWSKNLSGSYTTTSFAFGTSRICGPSK